jgi:PAS domain S-box-containing protein
MDFKGRVRGNFNDPNHRKHIEDTLKRVRLVLAYADAELRYTWFHNAHSDYAGKEVLGKRDDELQPNAAGRLLTELKQQVLSTGQPIRQTVHLPLSDGIHVYDMIIDTLRNDVGKAIGVVSAAVDVTAFVTEDRTLRETEALIRSLFDSAPLGLGVWDREARFLRLNQSLADINGLPIEAHIGKHPSEILPDIKDIHNVEHFMRQIMESGVPAMNVEIYGSTPADPETERVWREHFYPIRLEDEVIGLGAIVEDITELKQAQESLSQTHAYLERQVAERTAQLRQLNEQLQATLLEQERTAQELAEVRRRLAQSREAERLRLAHELHDTTLQDLTALTYDLTYLNLTYPDADLSETVQQFRQKITHINQTLRRIVGDLRPPILADFGLKAAIQAYIERLHMQYPNLHITLSASDDLPWLHETQAITLYRIQQQALRNVLQHAKATTVSIHVESNDNLLQLAIQDNGEGFILPPRWIELARKGHLGIVSMSERASEAGGTLEIDSHPGKGTTVRVKVPVQEMNEE